MILKIVVGVVIALVVLILVARKVGSTVQVERTFNAPVAKVWQLWTDEESMKKWWSPKRYTAPVIKNDFRVGGRYLFSMRSPGGEMNWNSGAYKEIVPQQKIVSTMSFSDDTGKAIPGAQVKLPGDWPDEIIITMIFSETGGKTTVTITEVGIPLIMKLPAGMGWRQQFDKLEALL